MGSALPLRGRSGQPIELGAGIVEHLKGIDQFAARFEQRALGIQDVQVGELALPIALLREGKGLLGLWQNGRSKSPGIGLCGGQPSPCGPDRSEERTSELQSLLRISYAVFSLKKKK